MKRLLHNPAAESSDSTETRVHVLEERIDRLATEEEHLQHLEERLEHRTADEEEHLRQLEERVEHLSGELAALGSLARQSAIAPYAASSRETLVREDAGRRIDQRAWQRLTTMWRAHRIDLEAWFGGYGALALASLSILFGVGAFISWALVSDRLGPWVRVSLGALAAAALAEVGWHLRSHGAHHFGNVLLALSLAVFHVDVWGAGPYLHLLSPVTSLTIVALASAALAWLALHEREEALFNVGFGGAILAPMVTSEVNAETVWWLLGYGLIVLTAGLVAARWKAWRNPPWLFIAASWLYIAWTAEVTYETDLQFAVAPGIFALLCSWFALTLVRGEAAARTALAVLSVAAVFVAGRVFDGDRNIVYSWMAATIAVSSALAARRDAGTERTVLLGTLAIPAATLWLALVPLENAETSVRALTAVAWAASSLALTWRLPTRARNVGSATAALCGGAVCPIVFEERSLALTISLSAYGMVAALVMMWLRTPGTAAGVVVWLTVATFVGYRELAGRTSYEYMPFATMPSLGALMYSVAWIVNFYLLRLLRHRWPDRAGTAHGLVGIAAAFAAFSWGRRELAGAFSPDAATFALIVYYALVGVCLIWVGRLEALLHLRPVGLGLSIYAALKAGFEASRMDVGFRVGGFLLSGIFLLAVAYWYQRSTVATATRDSQIDRHAHA